MLRRFFIEDDNMKICLKCGEEKPLSEYFKRKKSKDGYETRCKECRLKRHHEYVIENKETIKEKDRQRDKLPHRKKAKSIRLKTHIKKNPLKFKVRRRARYAASAGILIKPDVCEICNENDHQVEGHHSDYSKPLDVIWVCRPCHMRLHRDLNNKLKEGGEKK